MNLENVVFRHMILADKKFEDIKNKILDNHYEKLVYRKNRVVEEDKGIRERYVRNICEIKDEDNFKQIMKKLNTNLRRKRWIVLIVGGNCEEINRETKEVVVKVLMSRTKEIFGESNRVVKQEP